MADSQNNKDNYHNIDAYGIRQQYVASATQNIYPTNSYNSNQYQNTYDNPQYDSQQAQNRPWKGNPAAMYQGTKKITKDGLNNNFSTGGGGGQGFNNRRTSFNQGQYKGKFSNAGNSYGQSNNGNRSINKKQMSHWPNSNQGSNMSNKQNINSSAPQQEIVPPEYQNVDLVALAGSLDLNDPTQLAYYHEIANLVHQAQMQAAQMQAPQPQQMQRNNSNKNNTSKIDTQNATAFFKTKLCPNLLSKGTCEKGAYCTYAHSDTELKKIPDLTKTKLCPIFIQQGSCPAQANCNFAHGHHELKSTPEYYKTSLCTNYVKFKRCVLGDKCRYAHGETELRALKSASNVTNQNFTNQSLSSLDLQNQLNNDPGLTQEPIDINSSLNQMNSTTFEATIHQQ